MKNSLPRHIDRIEDMASQILAWTDDMERTETCKDCYQILGIGQ